MGKQKELKTKEERLKEGISLLTQLKTANVKELIYGYQELKRQISEWVNTGEPWEGTIEWEIWIKAFRDGVSKGFPYELRRLGREFQAPGMPLHLLEKEAQRIYDRKEGKSKPSLPGFEEKPDKLEAFSKKLVIARLLESYEVKP